MYFPVLHEEYMEKWKEFFVRSVHSHVCFKATWKLLNEQLASIPLLENDFLATFKLL
jgi:hypothetical protein